VALRLPYWKSKNYSASLRDTTGCNSNQRNEYRV
jgi:hypothetical protein